MLKALIFLQTLNSTEWRPLELQQRYELLMVTYTVLVR